jgi:hypothetical protein
MEKAMTSRLAVLVDGDNISGSHGARILRIAEQHGNPTVARVYANAQRPSEWHEACGYRMIHAGTGKNASDVLLAIDAVELALSSGVNTFVIASSDGDFTHLAQRLREYGATVTGVGEAKAPTCFRGACSSFVLIDPTPTMNLVTKPHADVTELDLKIRAVISANSKKGAGVRIAVLGPSMHSEHGTRISTYPERTWRAYLAARPNLYDLDPRGPEAMVRFKPEGFSISA